MAAIAPEEFKRLKEAEHRVNVAKLALLAARAEERRAWRAFQRAAARAAEAANDSDDLPHGPELMSLLAGTTRAWGA